MTATRRVGPLPVMVTAADVAAFAVAVAPGGTLVGAPVSMGAPLIFPISFLDLPEIRDALAEIADMARHVVLHEAQSFTQTGRIHADETYFLAATLTLGGESQPRLTIESYIQDESGTQVGEMHTALRLLPMVAPT